MRLMNRIRQAIEQQQFPKFIQDFVSIYYENKQIPSWVINSLKSVQIDLTK